MTTVHEDNNGALKLANVKPERMKSRSKHCGVKYHWFRSKLKPNKIRIVRVDKQRANFSIKSQAYHGMVAAIEGVLRCQID